MKSTRRAYRCRDTHMHTPTGIPQNHKTIIHNIYKQRSCKVIKKNGEIWLGLNCKRHPSWVLLIVKEEGIYKNRRKSNHLSHMATNPASYTNNLACTVCPWMLQRNTCYGSNRLLVKILDLRPLP